MIKRVKTILTISLAIRNLSREDRYSRLLVAAADRKVSPGSRGLAAAPGRPHTCSGSSRR